MKPAVLLILALIGLAGCARQDPRPKITIQRFFGECAAAYGRSTDVAAAEGECGIITAITNKFQAQNPDLNVDVNIVAWPGYGQLTAQIAAGDPPDLVTMHQSVISDYQRKGLLEPIDAILHEAGMRPEDFTAAARRGVTKDGAVYGLPIDTIGGLFHVNTKLFAQAGLMRNGEPVMPTSAEGLLRHARQFKAATGKPYLIQSQINDPATHTRNLYSYLLAQDAAFFPDPKHIVLRTPEARRVVELFRTLEREGLTTRNQDNPAAIGSFLNGQGGAFPTGTWMIGSFEKEADTPGRPLYRSYAVVPYPRLWGRSAAYVDGHAWVMPKRRRTPAQTQAIVRFIRLTAAHNYDWARTGHLPALQKVVDSPKLRDLPHRASISPLASTGAGLPAYIQRQGAIEGIVGEEVSSAVAGTKGVDQALGDAQRRVNDLLSRLD